MKNKKGVLGLDTVKAVILALLVMAVIVIAVYAALPQLQQSVENIDAGTTATVANESKAVLSTGTVLDKNYLRNCAATSIIAINVTSGGLIASGNYSVTRCVIFGLATPYNGTTWNISYTYNYDSNRTYEILESTTSGPASFFAQVPTFFVLLGVVVLILIITIVIVAVTRFSPGQASEEL